MACAPRTALVVALGALWFPMTVAAAPATAAPPVQLLSGLLSVGLSSPLATLSTTGSTAGGSLGTTTVVDGRLGATGYDVSVSSSGFDLLGPPVTSSPTTHIPGTAASVRVTSTSGGTPSTTAAKTLPASPLFHLTYGGSVLSVNLASTYVLDLSVSIPAEAAPGRYTGVVVQTVA